MVSSEKRKNFEKAIDDFDAAIASDPPVFRGLWRSWLRVYGKSHYELGFVDVLRGVIWVARGDPDKALTDFNKAIEIYPKEPAAFIDRGNLWSQGGEADKAIADYDQAIQISPKKARAYCGKGKSLAAKGDYRHALLDLTLAIELSPDYIEAYKSRGEVWTKPGENEKAKSDYDIAEKLHPKQEPSSFGPPSVCAFAF
jgi:tetratricopeptide (TPR) repeat protein